MNNTEMVARYYHLRELGQEIGEAIVGTLRRDVLEEAALRLGMLRNGQVVTSNEDELAILLDYCLFDVRRRGKNAVERFLAESPPRPRSEQLMLLQAMVYARFSLWEVEEIAPGVGVQLRDLIRGDRHFTMEVSYSSMAAKGDVLATRLYTPDTFAMTTGVLLPRDPIGDRAAFEQQLGAGFEGLGLDITKPLSPEQESTIATHFLRTCLSEGVLSHVTYEAPNSHDAMPPACSPQKDTDELPAWKPPEGTGPGQS